ncbi:alpha-N-acetylgalactosamine-specific lectin-like [Lytechinus variegatus]|uniref:alpha-N-acetylgalactosamine-specific lectin-like n=1 Tax=Lytechinus variegatus TaxID=7654 RepID=UPI001BB2C072|nr:alpha-N-acetylgalactosamine-specific lectin-like [Lytechinus variegatus]
MRILMLIIAVATTTMCYAKHSCPQFWNLFEGNCYRYQGDRLTWSAAEARCNEYFTTKGMGHLASVHNLEENRFIYELFKSSVDINNIPDWEYDIEARYPVYGIWIGLHQTVADGSWVNSDGKAQGSFERWIEGEPNNNYYDHSQVEDCVHIWRLRDDSDTAQRWNDMYCNEVMSFVCKMPANEF